MKTTDQDNYWKEMEEDPDFKLCKREARIGALTVLALFTYVVTVIYFMGFRRSPEEYTLIFGMPDWLVLGQFLPTLILVFVVIYLAKRVLKPLHEERYTNEAAAESAESPLPVDGSEKGMA